MNCQTQDPGQGSILCPVNESVLAQRRLKRKIPEKLHHLPRSRPPQHILPLSSYCPMKT